MKKTLLFSSGLIAVLGGAYISPMGQVGMNQAYAADSIKNSYLNNNFYKPNSGHYGQVQLADQSVGAEENASEWGKSRAIKESKRTDANKEYNNGRLLSDKNRDGQFTVKADVGYFYNFANQWNSGAGKVKVNGSSAVGYGASVGYTHKSGLGLSADYLGSNNKFNTAGRNYDASLHTIALTPSYRFSLDKNDEWGLRVGLGMGLSISNVAWGAGPAIASGVVGGSAVHPTGKGSSIPADSRPVKNNAGNSGAGNGKSAGGAYYTKYTDAQDKTFAVSACNNEPATRVYDSSGYLLAGHNRCANGATRVAATNDNRIVQWLVNDSTARLGSAEHPNGGGHVAANVWLRLLKAADGDPEALASLASTANPRPTDSQARDALIRLMGGYDGKHAPAGYSAGGTYETKRKAAELGVSPSQLENLTKAGIVFKDAPVPLTEIAGATPVQPLPTPPATGGAPFKATGLTPADPATGGAPFKATGLTPADPATGGAPFKAMGLTPADPATGGAPFKATDLIPSKEWEKPFKATVINPSQELTGGQPFKATKLNPTNEVTGGAPFTSTKLTPAHGATGGAPFKATALMPSQEVTGGTPFKATELNPSQKRAGEPDKNGETAGKPTGNEPSRPITPERPTPTEITA
ncbi:MAG: hypothetical protein ORN57_05095, partial [Alphaproteobacteria bacterium]|nr:hypothetical protein [Alphaproteobacteria bacterium]